MRQGLVEDRFRADFQPIFDARSGRVSGVEALARWAHPTLGDLESQAFIALAERSRLVSEIGCDFGQGFLFAHPMEADAALTYWRQSLERPII